MTEAMKSPTSIFVPDLDYPADLAKTIAAYNTAHEAHATALVAVSIAAADMDRAPARDTEALINAVAASKTHPGEKHTDTARKNLAIAEEQCRVARETATTQTDITRAALTDATDQLIPLVFDHIRTMGAHYENVVADCQKRESQARADLANASAAVRMLAPSIAKIYGLTFEWGGAPVTAPTWPTNTGAGLEGRIAGLERLLVQAKRAHTHRAPSTTWPVAPRTLEALSEHA